MLIYKLTLTMPTENIALGIQGNGKLCHCLRHIVGTLVCVCSFLDRFWEKVAAVPATGLSHSLCPPVVFCQEISKMWSSSGIWMWPGIQRNTDLLLLI